ncbi:IS30 family transposase, partial [uncultured Desulfovibrio sp.]|uniref:IS30 family transposase n=1 Tax=uncultured Desulfovibrio sp. TaxID=167968 RepID=UPI002638E75B
VVAAGIKQLFSRVPAWFFKSITYDQGREFFNYKRTDHHFGTASSFRHAGCPGERGLNERTNGLLRQFFPRTRNFRGLGEHETARAVAFITHRPRKKSGDRTTVEKMREDGVFLVSTFV